MITAVYTQHATVPIPARGPEAHPGRPHGQHPHIHIGPIGPLGRPAHLRVPDGGTSTTLAKKISYWFPAQSGSQGFNRTKVEVLGGADGQTWVASNSFADGLGRVVYESSLQSSTQHLGAGYEYDGRGNMSLSVAAMGMAGPAAAKDFEGGKEANISTRYSHDGLDRLTKTELLNGYGFGPTAISETTTQYHANRVRTVDNHTPSENSPDWQVDYYDIYGQLTQRDMVNSNGGNIATREKMTYDKMGRLLTVKDKNNNETVYTYDKTGRMLTMNDPDRGLSSYVYNNNGSIVSTTDGRGQTIAYTYNNDNQQTAIRKNSPTGTVLRSFQWDPTTGEETTATSIYSDYSYTTSVENRDVQGRVTQSRIQINPTGTGFSADLTYGYAYRTDGQLALRSYPAVGDLAAELVGFTFDQYGRPDTMAGTDTLVSGTDYDIDGRLYRRYYGDGANKIKRVLTYKSDTGQLGSMLATVAPVTGSAQVKLQHTSFGYGTLDPGAPTITKDEITDQLECWRHDQADRLVEAWTHANINEGCYKSGNPYTDNNGPAPYHLQYTFDDNANLTKVKDLKNGSNTLDYSFGQTSTGPHFTSTTKTGGATTSTANNDGAGNINQVKDPANNVTVDYSFDELNQLSTIIEPGGISLMQYGPDGSRIRRFHNGNQSFYAGDTIINKAGETVTATRTYTQGSTLIATRSAAGVAFHLGNEQGTNTLTVKHQPGTTLKTPKFAKYTYTPYGAPRTTTIVGNPNDTSNRRFLSQIDDTGIGQNLTYLNARYYNPQTQHFISPDPLRQPGRPATSNAYLYSRGGPIAKSDPTGLWDNSNAPEGRTAPPPGTPPPSRGGNSVGGGASSSVSSSPVHTEGRGGQQSIAAQTAGRSALAAIRNNKVGSLERALPVIRTVAAVAGVGFSVCALVTVGNPICLTGVYAAAAIQAAAGTQMYMNGNLSLFELSLDYVTVAFAGLSLWKPAAGVGTAAAAAPGSLLDDAAFAQTTFRETFSSGGRFAGQSIDDVAGSLRSGALTPGDVPIDFIVRDGSSLILNTRSAQALTRAGVPRSQWLTTNVTGNAAAEARLTAQLARNGLDSTGTLGPISSGG